MVATSIGKRIKETYEGFTDLMKMVPIIKEHTANPKKFWLTQRRAICTGMKERYSITEKPDIEVLIPIHYNAVDLPLLFYGLSRQIVNPDKKVGLTVVMHNNQNVKKWNMFDDGSWRIMRELLSCGVPIKMMTLVDPLLTGPHMAWQYLIAKSTGKQIAILDADCLPPSQWVSRITKPMEENNKIRFTGGVRIEMTGLFPFSFTTKINYIRAIFQHIIDPYKPNLPRMKSFQGGQGGYRRNLIYSTFNGLLGGPEGDSVFAGIMVKKYGEDCFAFADAPVFCKVTNPKRLSKEDVFVKMQRMLRSCLPRKFAVRLQGDRPRFNKTMYYISLYSRWFRPIIDRYIKSDVLTSEEIMRIFIQTAIDQGFYDNPHVRQFIKRMKKEKLNIHNNQQLLKLYCSIAENCHRPTLLDHLRST